MGKIGLSWELIQQSFSVLLLDTQLVFLPIASAISCATASAILLSGYALFFRPEIQEFFATRPQHPQISQTVWVCFFFLYLVNYFIVIFFNVALVSAAANRLAGGNASINDGLQLAWQRKGKIFQWALLASTVGMLLNALEERAGWLGRLGLRILGVAWRLGSYFVVPVLVAEDLGPVEALSESADLIRETWGEEVAGSFSFSLIFMLMALPGIALPFILERNLGPSGRFVGIGLTGIYFIVLAVTSATVQGIFLAALYRYAKTKEVSFGFNRGDLAKAWQPKN